MVRWRWIDCFTRKRIEKTLLFTEYYACIIIWRIFIREYACLCAELRYWIVSEQEIWRKCPFLSGLKYHRCSSNMAETLNLGLDSSSRIDRFTGWNPLPFFSFFFFFPPFYICITVVYALFIEYRWWNIVFACYIRMRFFCFIHPLEQRRPCYILMLVDHL